MKKRAFIPFSWENLNALFLHDTPRP